MSESVASSDASDPVPGAVVEWVAFTPPGPGEGMNATKGRTVVEVSASEELDDSSGRFMLLGWNYGPATIDVFQTSTGDSIAEAVTAQSPFAAFGADIGGVTVTVLEA